MQRFLRFLSRAYSALVFLFLYAPIVVLIVFSFNESKSRSNFTGFTFNWYIELFRDRDIMYALYNTLRIALIAAVVATVIGTVAAIGIHSMRGALKGFILNVSYLPMLNPDIVTGISLLLLYVFLGIPLGFYTLLLSHIAFCIPYVILSVMPKLKQMNENIYEAALDLGATPMRAIWKVIIPEIRPGIVTGFILSITLSIDDFVISFFTTGPGETTLSLKIYAMARRGIRPEINALSSLLFVTVLALLIIVNLRSGRAKKEHKKPAEA